MQLQTFYNGLSDTRTVIDDSSRSELMKKTTDQSYGILEDMEINSKQWLKEILVEGRRLEAWI